ncbi:MAG: hypothetical protein AAGC46_00335 [Solirubrobacteraceae bacterium]|nr:hypothetical protein [Patulibacter sp.]
MNEDFQLRSSIGTLQKNIKRGRAVFVLGAGCQRVAYDSFDSEGWTEVRRRVRMLAAALPEGEEEPFQFLEKFWQSKLSDETQIAIDDEYAADHAAAVEGQSLRPEGVSTEAKSATDRARIVLLALPIFNLFAAGTRRLGASIASGETPVPNWHQMSDSSLRRGPKEDPSSLEGLQVAVEFALQAATSLQAWRAENGKQADLKGRFDTLSIKASDCAPLRKFLDAVEITALELSIKGFASLCIGGRLPTQPGHTTAGLNGANVDWLGDLLWHILVCDALVPPSQRELAFYLNLPRAESQLTSTSVFSRPRPGEYRFGSGGVDGDLDRDERLRSLLKVRANTDISDPSLVGPELRELYATLASVLAQQGIIRKPPEGQAAPSTLPVALVAGYDLLLEHYLLGMLPVADERRKRKARPLHVVLPVRLTSPDAPGRRGLDWVVVTMQPTGRTSGVDRLAEAERSVAWLHRSNVQGNREPVIIHVSGAPFLNLLDGAAVRSRDDGVGPLRVSEIDLKGGMLNDADNAIDWEIEPAFLFDEYEASLAAHALRRVRVEWLNTTLQWNNRSWLFLAEGFPEWVPRFRLLNTSLAGHQSDQRGARSAQHALMAVDREFSWPEASLLGALGFQRYHGDLSDLRQLATNVPPEDPADIHEFFTEISDRYSVALEETANLEEDDA